MFNVSASFLSVWLPVFIFPVVLLQMPSPYGPGGVPTSGLTMYQLKIKAVHDSAQLEEKQRQDQGDLERRAHFNTRSPTVLDRDGTETADPPRCLFFFFMLHL